MKKSLKFLSLIGVSALLFACNNTNNEGDDPTKRRKSQRHSGAGLRRSAGQGGGQGHLCRHQAQRRKGRGRPGAGFLR